MTPLSLKQAAPYYGFFGQKSSERFRQFLKSNQDIPRYKRGKSYVFFMEELVEHIKNRYTAGARSGLPMEAKCQNSCFGGATRVAGIQSELGGQLERMIKRGQKPSSPKRSGRTGTETVLA